jgi:hypothetical protein
VLAPLAVKGTATHDVNAHTPDRGERLSVPETPGVMEGAGSRLLREQAAPGRAAWLSSSSWHLVASFKAETKLVWTEEQKS